MRRTTIHLTLWLVVATPPGFAQASGRHHHHAVSEAEARREGPARSRSRAETRREERGRPGGRTASAAVAPAKPNTRELQPEDLIGGLDAASSTASSPASPALRGSLGADLSADLGGVGGSAPASGRRASRGAARAKRPGHLREVVLEDGQSLDDLAVRTGVSVADLARLNGLASGDDAPTGMRLKLPTGAMAPPAPSVVLPSTAAPPSPSRLASTPFTGPAASPVQPAASPPGRSSRRELAGTAPSVGPRPYGSLGREGSTAAPAPARRGGRTEADALAAYAVASARAPHLADREEARHERFVWPLRAEVTSSFGGHGLGRRNDGVDLAARPGDPVRASAAGEVVYAGKEIAGSGGNLVLLKHADGWVTAYSHLGRLTVAMRQTVDQGQELAESPDVAGASVHFEVRQPSVGGAKPVDPLSVLPSRGGGETGRG